MPFSSSDWSEEIRQVTLTRELFRLGIARKTLEFVGRRPESELVDGCFSVARNEIGGDVPWTHGEVSLAIRVAAAERWSTSLERVS